MPSNAGRRRSARASRTGSNLLAPLVTALGAMVKTGVRQKPFQRDAAFIEQMLPLIKAVNLYHDTEFRGWEHVPRDRPCLIVGNHSGGADTIDFAFLLYKWIQERGAAAPLYGLAYNLLFGTPIVGSAMRRVGVIPASHANARKALAMGAAVSVFPGGEHEVFRPWRERNRIDFGGHMGFVRLAITTGVPVVPMTIHGAHQSTLVLTRGRRLAQAAGIDRLHVNVFPLIWNIPFGLTPAFVPSVQLPSKVTVHFGAPLDWSRYRPRQARDPAALSSCYDEITKRMQTTLSRLARERPYPVLDRLREIDLADALREVETALRPRPPAPRRRAARRRKAS